MTDGIDITMQTLAQSKNGAAPKMLEKALRSSFYAVRHGAGKGLVALRGGKGICEIIRQYIPNDALTIEIIEENRDKFIPALKNAIQDSDAELSQNALNIAYARRFYELIPFLMTIFMDQSKEESKLNELERIIGKLQEKFTDALEERKNRRFLYGTVLPEIFNVITKALNDYHKNDPDLILLMLFRLFPYLTEEHSHLAGVLRNPAGKAYGTVYHLFLMKQDPAVYNLIFYLLNNANPPMLAATAFAKRSDIPFVSGFLKLLTEPVSEELKTNFASISKPDWLNHLPEVLPELDEQTQQGLVLLLGVLNTATAEITDGLQTVFHLGTGTGRTAALSALSHYAGERIDKLIWEACGDSAPKVQMEALRLLPQRNVPNVNVRLLQFAGNPNGEVRATVLELLPNFRFSKFAEGFDQMSEDQRRIMFKLVRAMDSETLDGLTEMLTTGDAAAKNKALQCVRYGNLTAVLEDAVCAVLTAGESPALRKEAAELLTGGQREASRNALVQAMHRDPDADVRAAAKMCLEKRPVVWKTVDTVS
ncbi:MAG: hypothetical protein LBN39_11100 [Planctomycetaceae bacterium]|jgi:hypothetical protein|nr:hypothetical protein [Planctomycetaceae bacterium]